MSGKEPAEGLQPEPAEGSGRPDRAVDSSLLRKENEHLRHRNESLRKEHERLRHQNDKLSQKLEKIRKRVIENCRDSKASLEQLTESYEALLKSNQDRADEAERQRDNLRRDLQNAEALIADLRKEHEAERQRDNLRRDLQNAEALIADLRKELENTPMAIEPSQVRTVYKAVGHISAGESSEAAGSSGRNGNESSAASGSSGRNGNESSAASGSSGRNGNESSAASGNSGRSRKRKQPDPKKAHDAAPSWGSSKRTHMPRFRSLVIDLVGEILHNVFNPKTRSQLVQGVCNVSDSADEEPVLQRYVGCSSELRAELLKPISPEDACNKNSKSIFWAALWFDTVPNLRQMVTTIIDNFDTQPFDFRGVKQGNDQHQNIENVDPDKSFALLPEIVTVVALALENVNYFDALANPQVLFGWMLKQVSHKANDYKQAAFKRQKKMSKEGMQCTQAGEYDQTAWDVNDVDMFMHVVLAGGFDGAGVSYVNQKITFHAAADKSEFDDLQKAAKQDSEARFFSPWQGHVVNSTLQKETSNEGVELFFLKSVDEMPLPDKQRFFQAVLDLMPKPLMLDANPTVQSIGDNDNRYVFITEIDTATSHGTTVEAFVAKAGTLRTLDQLNDEGWYHTVQKASVQLESQSQPGSP